VDLPVASAEPTRSEPAESIISIQRVSKTYGSGEAAVLALDNVALELARGQFVSLLGPSGCGKSTLLMAVAGLLPVSAGAISLRGQPVRGARTDLGIVFQSPTLLDWRDALGNIMLQAEARNLDRARARQRAIELLTSVGLAGFEHRLPRELSGGMRQRVAICRALLHDPDVLLMDEPFGALDALTRDQMNLDLQRLWQQSDKSVLFVTHSVSEAVFLSDRVVVMSPRPGQVVLDLAIDLPRPRRLQARETPEFGHYVNQIHQTFRERGVLREDA
jgi:NitT/TauT family transport system ATP-binding protein